jgi:hypothetical protein
MVATSSGARQGSPAAAMALAFTCTERAGRQRQHVTKACHGVHVRRTLRLCLGPSGCLAST